MSGFFVKKTSFIKSQSSANRARLKMRANRTQKLTYDFVENKYMFAD